MSLSRGWPISGPRNRVRQTAAPHQEIMAPSGLVEAGKWWTFAIFGDAGGRACGSCVLLKGTVRVCRTWAARWGRDWTRWRDKRWVEATVMCGAGHHLPVSRWCGSARDKALRESSSAWAFKTSLKKRKKAKVNVFGIRMYLECLWMYN